MNLPDNLPPLPPVPDGYAVNAWEYRGTEWNPGDFRNYAYHKPGLSDGWVLSFGCKPIGSSGHYIEAVRETATPSAQLFATLDPENGEDQPASGEATGVEARVCEAALAPFRNVARGIPDNWPGQCILRFDQRDDGTIFLSYHGVNDAFNGITIDQWRALLAQPPEGGQETP